MAPRHSSRSTAAIVPRSSLAAPRRTRTRKRAASSASASGGSRTPAPLRAARTAFSLLTASIANRLAARALRPAHGQRLIAVRHSPPTGHNRLTGRGHRRQPVARLTAHGPLPLSPRLTAHRRLAIHHPRPRARLTGRGHCRQPVARLTAHGPSHRPLLTTHGPPPSAIHRPRPRAASPAGGTAGSPFHGSLPTAPLTAHRPQLTAQ